MEAKFFGPFPMLNPVEKQAYKLKLFKNWRIHHVFYMSLLEQDTIKKGHKFSLSEFELGNNKKYKIEAIQDNTVYAKEVDRHLPWLYYLVA